MDNTSIPSGGKRPFRVWVVERRVFTIDVLAADAWEAKAYATEHSEQWVGVDGSSEANVEQVLLHRGPDFRAANGSYPLSPHRHDH